MRSGSGGAGPNSQLVVTLDKAFENNGFSINRTVFDKYNEINSRTIVNSNTKVESASDVCESNEYSLKDDVLASCDEYNDAAIVTLVRTGSEDRDINTGGLDLNSDEDRLLRSIKNSGKFNKIIVLINSPTAMSMDWVNKDIYGIDAIIYMGVPGYYGVGGIVHVLAGQKISDGVIKAVNPSGHLVNTFAANASSSPAVQNFGNSNLSVYKEGVYVGYKYYETRYEDAILGQGNASGTAGTFVNTSRWDYADEMGYPFGFGLSYTTFEQKIKYVMHDVANDTIEVGVEVKNTGSIDGKASVQVYAQQPYTEFDKQNGLGKSAISLMGYDKVDVKAGETVDTKIVFDRYLLCTYDYKFNKGYILEGGDYYFAVGNGAHEALNNIISVKAPRASLLVDHNKNIVTSKEDTALKMTFDEDLTKYKKSIYNPDVEVTNQFEDTDYNYFARKNNGAQEIRYLDRQDWQETWPTKTTASPATNADLNMATKYNPTDEEKDSTGRYSEGNGIVYNVTLNEPIFFADMANVPLEGIVKEGKFQGQDGAEVWDRFISQMSLDDLIISITDNRGILDVQKVYKQGNSIGEGAEGILGKFQYGDQRWATGFPAGPMYTGTWDHEMQKKFGAFYGEEALYCGIYCVNGPRLNINRTPYSGRGSEGMSEDAMLNYYTSANIISTTRRKGVIVNVKHCALNNQETARQRLETYCDEQTLREIYLRPFEGAVTKGKALGLVTSYNRIGTTYAACHKALMENVFRGEWNYKGFFMKDALTGSNTDAYANGPSCLYNGTDIFMLDGGRGSQLRDYIVQNDDGVLLKSLQRANKYVMYAMVNSIMGGVTVEHASQGGNGGGSSTTIIDTPVFQPITDEIKALAALNAPEHNLEEVVIPQEEEYDYSRLDYVTAGAYNRGSNYVVYVFEGSYTEGWQGDYSSYKANFYLWDDGIYTANVDNTKLKGFWYNDIDGDGTKDCLNMVSNISKYENINCDINKNSFYQYNGYIYLGLSWGQRSMIIKGRLAYDTIAIAIDTTSTGLTIKKGTSFETVKNSWVPCIILQNLTYGYLPAEENVTYAVEAGLVTNGVFNTTGNFVIEATWNNFTCEIPITIVD